MPDEKTYRWTKIDHPEQAFWGVPTRLPWPVEANAQPNPQAGYPAGDMREGLRRLRIEGGAQWNEKWEAIAKFCDSGDELAEIVDTGDFDAMQRKLEEMDRLHPGTAYYPFNLAFALQRRGDDAGARDAMVMATERAPKMPSLWARRGSLHEKLGEKKEAIASYRRAMALPPKNEGVLQALQRLGVLVQVTTHDQHGNHKTDYMSPEDFRAMVVKDVAKLAPDAPLLRHKLAQFRAQNDGQLSLLVVDRILTGNPADALDLRVARADALRLLKRLPEASTAADEILAEHPAHAEALYVRSWCHFDAGEVRVGWNRLEDALASDPNHQKAVMTKFTIGRGNKDPNVITKVTTWAKLHNSWRGYWGAAVQCLTDGDSAGCLHWAETAYRMAPEERDAVMIYATGLNNAGEKERTAALIHPRLPNCPGDWELKAIFAGAILKLGLQEEAIRIYREALAEPSSMPLKQRHIYELAIARLCGHLAEGDIEVSFHTGTHTLKRGIWFAPEEVPTVCLMGAGRATPFDCAVKLQPPPDRRHLTTGSLHFLQHEEACGHDPVSLGWFRVHELDYPAAKEPPVFTLRVNPDGKVQGYAHQDARRLRVTWSLYRVPSMEGEPPRET